MSTPGRVAAPASWTPEQHVPLVDLLDRVLARGVVVSGEITISVAGVDLVHVSLRALISAVRPDLFGPAPETARPALEGHEAGLAATGATPEAREPALEGRGPVLAESS